MEKEFNSEISVDLEKGAPILLPPSDPKSGNLLIIVPNRQYTATETFELIYGVPAISKTQLANKLQNLRRKGLKAIRIELQFKYLGKEIQRFIDINQE